MKKVIALLLSLLMVVSLFGCTPPAEDSAADAPADAPADDAAEAPADDAAEAPADDAADASAADAAGAPADDTAAADDEILIGISMPNLQSSFFEGELSMTEQTVEANGAKYLSVVAESDSAQQKSQIEDLISKGVDAVICVPNDTEAIVSSIADCKAAGIPFIAMGRMPADMTDVSLAVTCDNYICADVCGDALVAGAAECGYETIKVIEIVGDLKDQNAVERSEGFQQYCEENGIEIVATVASEWDADTCFARLTDTVQSVDDFNAIYCPSDFLLPTIMSVLNGIDRWVPLGEEGHVLIASIDGDPVAMDMITSGYVYATANTDAFDFGKYAAEGAIEIAKGNAPAEVNCPIPVVGLTASIIEEAGDTIWGNVYK